MINWTDADNRMQAHFTTTDRIDRHGWQATCDAPSHGRAGRPPPRLTGEPIRSEGGPITRPGRHGVGRGDGRTRLT